MKLGLLIKITNIGVSEAYSINKNEEWARYAGDVRPAINTLNGFDGSGKSILLTKFLGGLGYMLCLIKARPEGSGRGGDNVSAWIHVPSNCELSNSEIVNLLFQVESAISASTGIDTESLKKLFDEERIVKEVMISATSRIVSNKSNGYAVRLYNNGEFNLKELLGSKLAQKEYSTYQGILFVDNQIGLTPLGTILDFEPKEIYTYAPLPPTDGFTPCFPSNGRYIPFDKAIEVPNGEQVTIHWYREGYSIIKKSFMAGDDAHYPQSVTITPVDYKIIVRRDYFHIYDPNSIPVTNADISIDGMTMMGDSMDISESSYNEGVRLLIRVKGLADYRKEKEKLSRNMQIFMGHHFYHYDFEIPLRDGEEKLGHASFSIETHHKLKHCPIEGYETEDYNLYESNRDVNRLSKSGDWKMKIKFFLYGVASVIIAALLIVAYNELDNYKFQLAWPPFKKVSQQYTEKWNNNDNNQDEVGTDIVPVDSLTLAINYLDRNEVWNKDSLEAYPATRGLFDDLNDFDVSNVTSKFETHLSGSSKLEQVKNALTDNSDKHYNPRIGKDANDGKYNPVNDKKISVPNYIDWLSKDHSKDIQKQEQPTTPSRIKEGSKKVTPQIGNEKPEQPKNNGRKIN